MRQPVRVVLADDHDAFVEGLGMVLSAEHDLEVVALAGDGASALQAVLTHRPDVLVVDTQMPGPAVTELVRLVGQARPATRVLLLAEDAQLAPSSRPDPGGHAGMTRAVSAGELGEAIRAVAAGVRVVAPAPPAPPAPTAPPAPHPAGHRSPQPSVAGAPEREGNRRPGGAPGAVHSPARPERDDHAELLLRSLSERERQVLGMLAHGWSNRRIAEACFLSLNTVRTHVQNVLVKLGVHSKLEAAALAVRQGLVSLDDRPA
jgi:DNA-binding NarL/FixJ family response regulator